MKHLLITVLLGCALSANAQEPVKQTFHANGRLESTRYQVGGTEQFITYYESGRVREMGGFRNGRKHGTWKQFDEGGAVLAEAFFVKGRREGVWSFRDGSNNLRGHLRYDEGRLTEGSEYAGGELVAQRAY